MSDHGIDHQVEKYSVVQTKKKVVKARTRKRKIFYSHFLKFQDFFNLWLIYKYIYDIKRMKQRKRERKKHREIREKRRD